MTRTSTNFSVWEVSGFPSCDMCDTRLYDGRHRHSIVMMRDGAVYLLRAAKPTKCIGCGELHETVHLFASLDEATDWVIELTTNLTEEHRIPVFELDEQGCPVGDKDTELVF